MVYPLPLFAMKNLKLRLSQESDAYRPINLKKLLVPCEGGRKGETLSMFGARTSGVWDPTVVVRSQSPTFSTWTEMFHLLLAPQSPNPFLVKVFANIQRAPSKYRNIL